MKKILFFLMAIIFAIQGWSQATLNETFDGTTFPPEDWTKVTTQGTVSWERYTSSTPRGLASASVVYESPSHTNWLITPKLVVGSSSDSIIFWIKAPTVYAGTTFSVLVSTTDSSTSSFGTTPIFTLSSTSPSQITTTWTRHAVSLMSYVGQNVFIAFKVDDTDGLRVMLDDVQGPNLFVPSCPRTSIPTIANITSSSCDISWTELGTATAWTLEYKPTSDVWANATTLNLTSTTTNLNNLPSNTPYDFRVKSVCISGVDESLWKIGSFRTACDIITNFPWIEGFESTWNTAAVAPGNKVSPFCWYIIDSLNTGTYFWKTSSTANTGSGAIYMQGYGSATTTTATYNNNDWLISPVLSLTGGERLNFWAKKSSDSYKPDLLIYAMDVSLGDLDTTASNANFVLIGAIDTMLLTTTYQDFEYHLNSLVGNYRLAFVRKKIANGSVYLDDVKISVIPNCLKPTNITSSNKTINTIDLSWTNGAATNNAWYIYYKELNATNWDSVLATTNPFTLTSLTPSSNYQAYIRTYCGTELSEATAIHNFTTACGVISNFPWIEGFENGLQSAAVAPGNKPAPLCWYIIDSLNTGTYYWQSSSTVNSGTKALYMYGYGSATTTTATYNNNDWLITPIINFTGNERLTFWSKKSSTSYKPDLLIYAMDVSQGDIGGTTLPNSVLVGQIDTNVLSTTYSEYYFDLNSLVGQHRLAFVRKKIANGSVYIDDVKVAAIPTCFKPTQLATSNNTVNSVDLTWTNGMPTDNAWWVYYKNVDSTSWDSAYATTNPFTLSNLDPTSAYNWYVKTACISDISESSLQSILTTTSQIITTIPWSYGFEQPFYSSIAPGNKPSPLGWVVIDRGGTNGTYEYWWKRSTSSSDVRTGIGAAQCYTDYGTTNHNDWLITPKIALSGNEQLTFYARRSNSSTSELDEVSVFISSPDLIIDTIGMGQYDTLAGFTQIYNQLLPVGDWQKIEVNLSQYPGNRHIAFVRRGTPDGYYLRLDDVLVDLLPSCSKPTNILTSNITTTSVDLTWTNGQQTDASWYVYYKPSSATIWDSLLVNTNPYTLSNLTPATKYDVRMRTDCGFALSESSNMVVFVSKCYSVNNLPYTENFDTYGTASGAFPTCWSKPVDNSGFPSLVTTNNSAPASLKFESLISQPTYAVSPQISADINALRVRFMLRAESLTNSGTITVGVMSNSSDTTTFEAIQTILPTNTNFNPYEISFASATLSGANNFVAFRHNSNANNYWYWLDDVIIDSIPACTKPTNITSTNITTNSVDISWTNGNPTDNAWYIYYKPVSNTIWDSVSVTTSSPYTLSGLSAATPYQYYIRTDCSIQLSDATAVYSFVTKCNVVSTFPYTENFDTYGTSAGAFPLCWSRPVLNGNYPSLVTTYSSAPASLRFQSLPNVPTYAISPQLGSDIHALRVRFMLRAESLTSSGTMTIGVMSSNSDTTTFEAIKVIQPTNTSFNSYEVAFNNTTLSGTNNYIAFRQNSVVDNYYYWLDDVIIDSIPSCPKPTNLAISNITTTTADLSWTNGNPNNSSWWLYTKLASATTYDSMLITSASPYTISNLSPSSLYNYYMKTDCSTEISEPTQVYSFYAECAALTVPTTLESFVTVLPNICWSRFSGQLPTTGNATLTTSTGGWVANSQVTPHNVKVNLYSTQNYWLVTPSIDLGGGSSSNQVEFDVFLTDFASADAADLSLGYADKKFYVLISTDDGLTWTATNTLRKWDNAGSVDTLNKLTNVPLHVAIPLQDVSGNPYSGIVKIAFYGESTVSSVGDNDLHIDNFQVTGQVCTSPTALTASGITQTNATVSWTAGANETSWEVKLGTAGSTTMVTSPTYTFTGLTTATQYTAYVRANCGTSNSAWMPVTFTTSSAPLTAVVTTAPVTTFTYNTASFVGSYTPGADTINAVGFEYKTTAATAWTTQTVSPVASPFSYNATGLTPSTQYKVRAYVTKQGGVNVYGDTMTFTTAVLNAPIVTTDPVTSFTATTATFNGTVAQGTESIVSRGFEYKTSAQTWTSALEVTATGSTTITANVTGLVMGTTYNVRAYAETASGKTYGSEVSFIAGTPVVLGEVTTLGTTNVDTTSATLNGSVVSVGGATSSIEVGFVYSTTTNPVIDGANVTKVPVTYTTGMTNYNANITGLTDTTQYYVKSYITNSAGTAYGQEMTFITRKSGLNDIDVNSMSVQLYPNPATTEATLVIKGITGKAKIMISDVQGRTINTFEVKSVNGEATKSINVNNFANGVYYVRIQNANKISTQKLIVK